MEHTDTRELESAVEGILFASGEPIDTERICLALSLERGEVERALRRLRDYYAFERRGMRLLQLEDRWQLCSSPDHADIIRKAFEIRKPAKLSQPALEALTIIAYYQPTTRAYVDKLRGVDSSYTVGLLLERGLIETCGNLQAPGRPFLYRTTEKFLRSFHISSLDELPPLNEDDIPPQQLKIEDMELAQRLTEAESVPETQAAAPEVTQEPEAPEAVTEAPEAIPEEAVEIADGLPEEPLEPETVEELPDADAVEELSDAVEPSREMLADYPQILTARPVRVTKPLRRKPTPRKPYRYAGAFRTRRRRPGRRARKRRKIARPRHAPRSHADASPAPDHSDALAAPERHSDALAAPERHSDALAAPECHSDALAATETAAEYRETVSAAGTRRRLSGKAMRRCFYCLLCGCWLSWPFC